MGKSLKPLYVPPRAGDVKHSLAEINKAKELITYAPPITINQGLKKTTEWFVRHASQGTL
jgi:nucleoside-diphosphate-sugar epimerase